MYEELHNANNNQFHLQYTYMYIYYTGSNGKKIKLSKNQLHMHDM